jgi:hypothetical protein
MTSIDALGGTPRTVAHPPKSTPYRRKTLVSVRNRPCPRCWRLGSAARRDGLTHDKDQFEAGRTPRRVMDDDLGPSGSSATQRQGLQRLVADVALAGRHREGARIAPRPPQC